MSVSNTTDTIQESFLPIDLKQTNAFQQLITRLAISDAKHDFDHKVCYNRYDNVDKTGESCFYRAKVATTIAYPGIHILKTGLPGIEALPDDKVNIEYSKIEDAVLYGKNGVLNQINNFDDITEYSLENPSSSITNINIKNNKGGEQIVQTYDITKIPIRSGDDYNTNMLSVFLNIIGNDANFVVDTDNIGLIDFFKNSSQIEVGNTINYIFNSEIYNDPSKILDFRNKQKNKIIHNPTGVRIRFLVQSNDTKTIDYTPFSNTDASYKNNFFSKYNFKLTGLRGLMKNEKIYCMSIISYINHIRETTDPNKNGTIEAIVKQIRNYIWKHGMPVKSDNIFELNSLYQSKRSGDWLQALSTFDTRNRTYYEVDNEGQIITTSTVQAGKGNTYLVTLDRIAAAYALLMGCNVILTSFTKLNKTFYVSVFVNKKTPTFDHVLQFLNSYNDTLITSHVSHMIKCNTYKQKIMSYAMNNVESNRDNIFNYILSLLLLCYCDTKIQIFNFRNDIIRYNNLITIMTQLRKDITKYPTDKQKTEFLNTQYNNKIYRDYVKEFQDLYNRINLHIEQHSNIDESDENTNIQFNAIRELLSKESIYTNIISYKKIIEDIETGKNAESIKRVFSIKELHNYINNVPYSTIQYIANTLKYIDEDIPSEKQIEIRTYLLQLIGNYIEKLFTEKTTGKRTIAINIEQLNYIIMYTQFDITFNENGMGEHKYTYLRNVISVKVYNMYKNPTNIYFLNELYRYFTIPRIFEKINNTTIKEIEGISEESIITEKANITSISTDNKSSIINLISAQITHNPPKYMFTSSKRTRTGGKISNITYRRNKYNNNHKKIFGKLSSRVKTMRKHGGNSRVSDLIYEYPPEYGIHPIAFVESLYLSTVDIYDTNNKDGNNVMLQAFLVGILKGLYNAIFSVQMSDEYVLHACTYLYIYMIYILPNSELYDTYVKYHIVAKEYANQLAYYIGNVHIHLFGYTPSYNETIITNILNGLNSTVISRIQHFINNAFNDMQFYKDFESIQNAYYTTMFDSSDMDTINKTNVSNSQQINIKRKRGRNNIRNQNRESLKKNIQVNKKQSNYLSLKKQFRKRIPEMQIKRMRTNHYGTTRNMSINADINQSNTNENANVPANNMYRQSIQMFGGKRNKYIKTMKKYKSLYHNARRRYDTLRNR
jgi:hypothetical protein